MMKISSNGKIRRTEEEWQEIFSRFRESGMTEAAFCRQEKIAKSSFSKRRAATQVRRRKPAFVELTQPKQSVAASASESEMVLTLPGGATLHWKA
jgi:hypothetical protein